MNEGTGLGNTVAGLPPCPLLAELREKYEPKGEEFEVTLPHGEKLRFKRLASYIESRDLQVRCAAFVDGLVPSEKGVKAAVPPSWQPYFVADRELLGYVFAVAELCLEEDFAGKHLNCLILAQRMYPVFQSILEQIDLGNLNMLFAEAEAREVNAEKKD